MSRCLVVEVLLVLFLFFMIVLANLGPFPFHTNFKLSKCPLKKPVGILNGLHSLQINLGELSHPVYEHGISLHLLKSYLISLNTYSCFQCKGLVHLYLFLWIWWFWGYCKWYHLFKFHFLFFITSIQKYNWFLYFDFVSISLATFSY